MTKDLGGIIATNVFTKDGIQIYEMICAWCKLPSGSFTTVKDSSAICPVCKEELLKEYYEKKKD